MGKAGDIKGIGEAAICSDLDLLELREMPDEGVIEKRSSLHGTAYCQSLNCEYALSG
jgi:hypothetical protein